MAADEKKRPEPEPASFLRNLSILLPTDDDGAKKYPTLSELLLPKYKGAVCTRQGGTLRVKVEGTYYRVSLDCPTERVQCSLLIETLIDLNAQVERFLRSGEAQWSPSWDVQKRSRPVIEDVL
jgi:hypothetical protein